MTWRQLLQSRNRRRPTPPHWVLRTATGGGNEPYAVAVRSTRARHAVCPGTRGIGDTSLAKFYCSSQDSAALLPASGWPTGRSLRVSGAPVRLAGGRLTP